MIVNKSKNVYNSFTSSGAKKKKEIKPLYDEPSGILNDLKREIMESNLLGSIDASYRGIAA